MLRIFATMIDEREFPQLVRTHVPSVWALELLLLMKRERTRGWSAAALSSELRASPYLVEGCLSHFLRGGLVAQDADTYEFAPASEYLMALAELLESEYRSRPVALINIIAAPTDRIQQLADAFRFVGKPK
jgi:DNA-binding IclR family transcriptional regulator